MGAVTWRGIRSHPVRFALTVLAVALGTAFMSGTLALRSMMAETWSAVSGSQSSADVYLRGLPYGDEDDGLRAGVDLSAAERVADLPGVDRVLPHLSGDVLLSGADGRVVRVRESSAQRPGDQSTATPSRALVVWPDDPDFTVREGRLPTAADEVALEEVTSRTAGLELGDRTTVVLAGELRAVEVVGVVAHRGTPSGETTVVVDERTGREVLAAAGTVDRIGLYATTGGADQRALAAAVAASLPAESGIDVATGDAVRAEGATGSDPTTDLVPALLLLFAVIALVVGGFLIANTFAMAVRQDTRQHAVLRALGASPRQVFTSVVGQAAVVGLAGSLIGVAGGFGVVAVLRRVLDTMSLTLSGAVPVELSTVALTVAVGTVVATTAAAVPAGRAARVPPVAAMREQALADGAALRRRGVVGGALATTGAAAVAVSFTDAPHTGVLIGAGGAALFVGALVAGPALVPPAMRVLAWPFVRLAGPLAELARGNVTRRPRHTASTAGAVMIGMTLVGLTCVLATSVQTSIREELAGDIGADVVLQSGQGVVPRGAADAVAGAQRAASVAELRYASLEVDGEHLSAGAVPPRVFDRMLPLAVTDGEPGTALAGGDLVVLRSAAEQLGWAVGDAIPLANPAVPGASQLTARIGAVVDSASVGTHVFVPDDLYDALVPEPDRAVNTVFAMAADGDVEALRAELVAAVAPFHVVSVLDHDGYVDAVGGQVALVVGILYALLALSLVIAVLGVVNTLALSIMERTREIGTLRAIGLGRGQLSGTVVIEAVLIAAFGAVTGLVVGTAVGAGVPGALADLGLGHRVVPWGTLLLVLAGALAAGVLAAALPVARAARLPVLHAIEEE
jgi:putative ABC transport system permease protein